MALWVRATVSGSSARMASSVPRDLHIVAPELRKAKVFEEILRPVFSLLEGKPLPERCTFLSYDSVRELSELEHLSHLSDSVLDEYVEEASG